jgi:hypothetical protein
MILLIAYAFLAAAVFGMIFGAFKILRIIQSVRD